MKSLRCGALVIETECKEEKNWSTVFINGNQLLVKERPNRSVVGRIISDLKMIKLNVWMKIVQDQN